MGWNADFHWFLAGAASMLLIQIIGKWVWNVLVKVFLLCAKIIRKGLLQKPLRTAKERGLFLIKEKINQARPPLNYASRYFDDIIELNQKVVSMEKRQKGNVSLTDMPSIIVRDRNGDVCGEEYLAHNKPHRKNGPARWIKDGLGITQEYWIKGKKHRRDAPAVIIKMVDGSERMEYWIDGNMIDYTETCRFLKIGGFIRDDHQVFSGRKTSTDKNGNAKEEYYADGKLHRENGPARIVRTPDGSSWEEYWQYGNLLSVERKSGSMENSARAS
jgi:hypothetical protein